MTEAEIVATLDAAEAALDRGEGLSNTGFWKAVAGVKSSPDLVKKYADRIALVDRRAFEQWPLILVPNPAGNLLAGAALAVGTAALAGSTTSSGPARWVLFGGGALALFASSHGLAHLVVGRAAGIEFTHWYVGSVTRPQPGIKIDYSTYLRTPPRRRAWTHAAGAIVTKLLPFALIPVARAARLPRRLANGLAALGAIQLLSDAFWSVKASDWMRFRREMRYSR